MDLIGFVKPFIKKYRWMLVLTVISLLLLICVQLLAPWLIKEMVAIVSQGPLEQGEAQRITRLALLALGVYTARMVLQFLRSYMAHIAGWSVVADVRSQLYEHLQRLSLRFYENTQTGSYCHNW